MGSEPRFRDFGLTPCPQFLGRFSATSRCKAIESSVSYGAGDGNRTHVRRLGSYRMPSLPFSRRSQTPFRTRGFTCTLQHSQMELPKLPI